MVVQTFRQALPHLAWADVIQINSNPRLLLQLAAVQALFPKLRRPTLGSDIVLRVPESPRERLMRPVNRWLLDRVDHFFSHFKDVDGYEKHFGIGLGRSTFVAFKPNLRYNCDVKPDPDGEYVLCFGRSMRDFDTFFAAMEMLPYPGAIAEPDLKRLRANGSRFSRRLDQLPKNVRLLPHNPDDYQSQVEVLMGAKLVVVPLRKTCLVMAGTPYDAMLLGKCVLLTEGPAINGLFDDEVLPIPCEDAAGMARVIERAWNDRELRQSTAARGYKLALSLGGVADYRQRILDLTLAWLARQRRGGAAS